jgi:hypothetical protein
MPDEPRSPPVTPPGDPAGDPARDELDAAPPFLGWTALYLIVAAALVVEVAAFTALTLIYR